MIKSRKIYLPIIALLASIAGFWWVNQSDPTVEILISGAASRQLDRPVAIRVDLQNEVDNWVFVCGSVTEADGTALGGETIGPQAKYESDDFCALANSKDMSQLAEFDFGSTDMPAMDWLERHDLSPQIFTSEKR